MAGQEKKQKQRRKKLVHSAILLAIMVVVAYASIVFSTTFNNKYAEDFGIAFVSAAAYSFFVAFLEYTSKSSLEDAD